MAATKPLARLQLLRATNDLATVASMGVVAYLVAMLVHEVVGHALAWMLFGGRIPRITNVDVEYAPDGLSDSATRLVAAAGSVANGVVGIVCLVLLETRRQPNTRYFLWLVGHVNLFVASGYPMVLSFASVGDMSTILAGLTPRRAWQSGLSALGTVVSFVALLHAARSLDPFLGHNADDRQRRALELTLTPYLAGSTVNTVAGLLNPSGSKMAVPAAAASFGGTSFLLWVPYAARRARRATLAHPVCVSRSQRWVALGGACLSIYLLILGPGVPRRPQVVA